MCAYKSLNQSLDELLDRNPVTNDHTKGFMFDLSFPFQVAEWVLKTDWLPSKPKITLAILAKVDKFLLAKNIFF